MGIFSGIGIWVNSFFDYIFGFLISWNKFVALIIISFILTLLITLVYKWLTDQHLIKTLKEDIKGHQEESKNHKENPEKLMQIQKEAMEKNMKLMMHSMKPMLFTFLPIIIIFGWLRTTYEGWASPLFGWGWIWIYIIFSMIFSITLRKILKVH
ncbi:hypothetical protein CL618_02625 [archaeon]|nr:hypothetical protein [archaeon]|tara:strand:+ start:141 stop:602 length:462 start_codon:yes stop_codon:yes gene_type:complete